MYFILTYIFQLFSEFSQKMQVFVWIDDRLPNQLYINKLFETNMESQILRLNQCIENIGFNVLQHKVIDRWEIEN